MARTPSRIISAIYINKTSSAVYTNVGTSLYIYTQTASIRNIIYIYSVNRGGKAVLKGGPHTESRARATLSFGSLSRQLRN